MTDAFIFDAVRTPRGKGKRNGSLHEIRAVELLATTLNAIQKRSHLDTSEVDDGIFGCVTPIGEQGGNIAKTALLFAGWDQSVPGVQINRYCASGLDAVNLAALKIRSGLEDLIIAGGVESMSRVAMGSDEGSIMSDPDLVSRINYIPQGVAADLIATIEGFSREQLDGYAVRSQSRAYGAQKNGYFDPSIAPILDRNGLMVLKKDEYLRPNTNLETLAALPASFEITGLMGFDEMALKKYPFLENIQHVHTAGNSSGVVDGAAAVLLGAKEKGEKLGLKPRARIVATATVSTDPTIMLTGHVAAARKALKKAGMTAKNIDLWEVNEAFAAVALKFQKDMEIDDTILNVNGGAIALGHPLGATGAILLSIALDELERRNLKTALVALCAGAGMGVATIIERV